jgi:beta-glucosidase/6-phospho-beta-glucosidase/beta-galactosidase
VPWGFRKLLQYLHNRYTSSSVNGIPITITENGFATQDEANLSLEERIDDVQRQTYYRGYLKELIEAQRDDGIEIGGYMAWSLLE